MEARNAKIKELFENLSDLSDLDTEPAKTDPGLARSIKPVPRREPSKMGTKIQRGERIAVKQLCSAS